jgi:hypothetical protein
MPTLVKTPSGTPIKWKDAGAVWRDVQTVHPPSAVGPLLNFASGIAPRNGTLSHTISFGFTATAGSFLMVCVRGAVSHTATGWTKQGQASNSTQVAVFTKIATGGDTFTVSHNGSNYAVAWTAWEYVAGTTYHSAAGSTTTSTTMPTLSGLPGTPVEVFASYGAICAQPSGELSGATSTWTAPFIELTDQVALKAGSTDGCYDTIARQSGVTATSVTPVGTFANGNPLGPTTGRERLTWAVKLP